MRQLALPMVDVDPKFILEVASGLVEPAQLAEAYGYTPEEWLFLKNHDPFVKQVDAKKAELKAGGFTFRMKAAIAAEDILEETYLKAKEKDSSFHTQLEFLKFVARAAGIDAPVREQATGTAFSISINLGNGQSVQIGAATHQGALQDVVDAEEATTPYTVSFGAYQAVPLEEKSA
jgi:hypothetical protein